jgi:hypothetical protein
MQEDYEILVIVSREDYEIIVFVYWLLILC